MAVSGGEVQPAGVLTRKSVRLWTFAAFAVGSILAMGLYLPLLRNEQNKARELWKARLSALAQDRDAALRDYLIERAGDARTLAGHPRVVEVLREAAGGAPPGQADDSRRRLETHFANVRINYGYVGAYLCGPDARPLVWSPGASPLDEICLGEVAQTLQSGADRFVDLQQDRSGRLTFSHQALVGSAGDPLGVVVFVSDPNRWLYPLLERQPAPSRTAETLIGSERDGRVAFLSPLRFGSRTPPSYPVPVPARTLALTAALEGRETFGEFSDYRGEDVLASVRPIRGTPWGLVAKVDRAEAFERLGAWTFWYALISLLCILTAALFVYALLRRRRQVYFEALSHKEGLYRALSEQTRDIFVLARPDGTIVEANAAAEKAYGYTREELRRMNLRDLRAPSARDSLPADLAAAQSPGGSLHETVHLSRTGVEFPVEIRVQEVVLGSERLLAELVLDISERKTQEQRILKLNRLYRTLSEANQALVRAGSRRDLLQDTCRILVDHGGFLRACILRPSEGGGPAAHEACHPAEDSVGLAKGFAPPDPLPAETLVIRDGSGACAFLPLAAMGLSAGALCVASADSGAFDEEEMGLLKELAGDLSFALEVQETRERREQAERALEENEARLRSLVENMATCVAVYEPVEDGSDFLIVDLNASAERSSRVRREEVIGCRVTEVFPGVRAMGLFDVFQRVHAGGPPERHPVSFYQDDRLSLWADNYVFRLPSGHVVAVYEDVTDRKRAEAQQRFYLEALNSSLDEIYVFDAETLRFEFASRGALQNLGYTLEEVCSMTPADLSPAFTEGTFREAVAPLLSGDLQRLHFETEQERADGTTYPVEVHLQLFDTLDRPVFVAFIQDITERMRAQEALRESEEKYRSILENMQESYYEVDLAGNLTFFNDSLCALFGYPREELMGMNNRQYTDAENAKKLYQAFNEVYRTGVPTRGFGWEVIRKDGAVRTIEASVSLRRDAEGRPIGFRGVIRDATEERRAQEALRRSEERFRTLFENSPVGMYRTTPDGRIVEANPKIVSLLGFASFEELASRNLEEDGFQPSYPREAFKAEMERTGEVRGLESAWRRRDGQVLRIREHARAVRDDSGRIVCYDGVIEDVSAEHRAEEARRLLSTAIEQSHDAVVITDKDGTILYVNPAFERITGYSREEAVGQNPRFLKSGVQDEAFYKNMWDTILSGRVWTGRMTNRRKDGTHFVEQAVISPVRDEAGAIMTFVAAKRDITQEVELETRLEHAKSLETIGMVAGGMAHEVRNPLFAISTLTSALDKKFGSNEEIRPFIGYIQEHVQRLTILMNDLLALGRPVAKEQFVPCDLCGLAHGLKTLLAKEDAEGASRLDVDCTAGDAQILGQADKISQVLLNLVQNALHFSPSEGRVILRVRRRGDMGEIRVVDRGSGIPADFQPRLFQPFASRRQGGTGLGLAIVRKLVEAHGGTVEGANNEPGPGATFTVRLPLVRD